MATSRDTEVSAANALIKQIIEATLPEENLKGKKIVVREVPSSWQHTEYIDDHTKAFYLNLERLVNTGQVRVHMPDRPRYGGPSVVHPAPQNHELLVQMWRSMGKKGVDIIVAEDALDSSAIMVATDALLAKDKAGKAAAKIAVAELGPMAGVALAIAEAQAKALGKGDRGERPKQASRARQLDQDIAAALERSKSLSSTSHLRKRMKPTRPTRWRASR